MIPQWLIEQKRDGFALSPEDIRAFVEGFTAGDIPDYQVSALAMAILWRGMDETETAALTDAMIHSGDTLSFDDLPRPTADKHSTGGIGDKISLPLAPLVAAAGVAVPMISGRGLGITGGTLDKLESIPGFDARLSVDAFQRIVADVGCAIIGQTDRLAPADRKLYALRDVTGTVPSIPLITASILSKKIAGGAGTLVFDVKCGSGAFMKDLESARALARSLLSSTVRLGRRAAALVTDMSQPLGRTVGNALEVRESIEILHGRGPADVRELVLRLGALMLAATDPAPGANAARARLEQLLDDGSALDVFRRMVAAQGGDAAICESPDTPVLPRAPVQFPVPAPRSGFVAKVDADAIGRVALQLGAGRTRASDSIDPAVGISGLVQQGDPVDAGAPLLVLHAATDSDARALAPAALAAVSLAGTPPGPRQLVLEEHR
ncbi:MAG: thymidine phosphorylase [Kiritimatiellia bacterium]|jgi:pyrimidine-nucleoside phosphorylase